MRLNKGKKTSLHNTGGNMKKESVRKEYIDRLNSHIGSFFDKDKVIDEKVLDDIVDVSANTKLEVMCIISRYGEIVDIKIGETENVSFEKLDAPRNRLCGYRLIHTHPNGNAKLSNMDFAALRQNKFDLICAIAVDKGMLDAQVGFFDGVNTSTLDIFDARFINKFGVLEKMLECEKRYIKNAEKLYSNDEEQERAVLVGVKIGNDKYFDNMEELENLAHTNHIEVVGKLSQNRQTPDTKYFIGEGKIEELQKIIQLQNANLVIFDNELSGSKTNALEKTLGVKVIDRSRLILDIFAGRAKTSEGKLQVELAQLQYSLPRLSGIAGSSGRFGSGGTGMRGPGETKLELDRRVIEKNIQKKKAELERVKNQRQMSRKERQKNSKIVIAIVGYTNSGKSTLLNLLTKADVYAKDELFATLDTTTRTWWIDDKIKEVLLVDTVGFISRLPHEFIDAFSSTLEETVQADLLLHVVDISNKNYNEQKDIVNKLLAKLGAKAPTITVYNKIDKVENIEKEDGAVYISAEKNVGIADLKKTIVNQLEMLNTKK